MKNKINILRVIKYCDDNNIEIIVTDDTLKFIKGRAMVFYVFKRGRLLKIKDVKKNDPGNKTNSIALFTNHLLKELSGHFNVRGYKKMVHERLLK